MSSSPPNIAQQLPRSVEDYEERLKVLGHLLDKVKRESLALVRQSEAACELLGARVEELEEQVHELSQQQEFFTERLSYWHQRYSELETLKERNERRLQYRIEDNIGREMYQLITIRDLHEIISNKNDEIESLGYITDRAKDSPLPVVNENPEKPTPPEDPTPSWLRHNDPKDWYDIALQASRPPKSIASGQADGSSDGSLEPSLSSYDDVPVAGEFVEVRAGKEYDQFGSSPSSGSKSGDLQDEKWRHASDEGGEPDSADGESEDEEGEMPEGVEDLRAEVERLQLQVRGLKAKEKATMKREKARQALGQCLTMGEKDLPGRLARPQY